MQIDNFKHEDNWQDIKNSTMNTINKNTGKYPDSTWKRKLIMSEHSPIRRMKFYWRWCELKSWVSVHMVRHKIGIEHWVSTQRPDRTNDQDRNRDKLPQGALVNHACEADAQALINISRKRLCNCAAPKIIYLHFYTSNFLISSTNDEITLSSIVIACTFTFSPFYICQQITGFIF